MTLLLTILMLGAAARLADAQPLDVADGFDVAKLYDVPRNQGSWVSMTFDPQGRIIASHEGGGLYRVTLPPSTSLRPPRVEKLDVKIGGAQGLLYAFDSLYAVSGGVLRLRDTNGDGQFDSMKRLFEINGRGEHGPHAVVLGPQKRWLYLIAGNATQTPTGVTRDRIRWPAGAKPNPQGWVMRFDPDGNERELYCVGMRNAYGLAFSPKGELFTFDSDNEGFMGLPWYRPTNIYHLTSGADFGWRQGPQTAQSHHPDNAPPVLEVGPGSPTGMVFGAGTKFPPKYQNALFVSDWSYGRIYAIHMRPDGASYRAQQEFFISGRPLAVTDIRVGPDGAMYFITGGRGTQSALYRITSKRAYRKDVDPWSLRAAALRRKLAEFHGREDSQAVAFAWPHLRSQDRRIRYAARIAIEHQALKHWRDRALAETNPQAALEAMIALARQGDSSLRNEILSRLNAMSWSELDLSQRLALLRAYELTLGRMGKPNEKAVAAIRVRFDSLYPNANNDLNRELIKLLVDVNADDLIDRTIDVLHQTPTAMLQIHFLRQLNRLKKKPSADQRKRLASTLDLEVIRDTGARGYQEVSNLIDVLLKEVGAGDGKFEPPPMTIVKKWKMEDLLPGTQPGALAMRNLENGRAAFRKAQCHRCHRIGATGGVLGPNLTALAGRFKPRDVLEAIVEPDKVIADPYRTTVFVKTDGTQFTGQIVNLSKGVIQVRLDPSRPFPRVGVPEKEIESMRLSDVSLMPKGLLDTLTKEEILDLMAYLLERP